MSPTTLTQESPPFLGVTCSYSNKQWLLKEADEKQIYMLAQKLGLPEIIARLIALRGFDFKSAVTFLSPTLKEGLPDPSLLKDMDKAILRIFEALKNQEKITIFGDYDVDGATSSAVLYRFLRQVGAQVDFYIPDRLQEGYGPNIPALQLLKEQGSKVIITVDCGTTSFEPLKAAAALGLEVIVLDHHSAEAKMPAVYALINPNRIDEENPDLTHLAAVGLCFLFVVGLNRTLRVEGWYQQKPEPDLRHLLDLVALGTICDVVSLTGLNRIYVAQGLKVMRSLKTPGLKALCEVARITEPLNTYHSGFIFGPRINAGGRIGEPDLGVKLLTTDTYTEALALAYKMEELNKERQEIEAQVLKEAYEMIEQEKHDSSPLLLLAKEGWHPGVLGIVAGRLKERFNRPTFVIGLEKGIGKGSGRSVTGIHLGHLIHGANHAGLLLNGGGHAMAAGLTVEAAKIDALRNYLQERATQLMAEINYKPTLFIDGSLTPSGATINLVRLLESLAPFGAGNAHPRFAFPYVSLAYADRVGKDHVRCVFRDDKGGTLSAIAFRAGESGIDHHLLNGKGKGFHIAGTLRLQEWQGVEKIQLMIEDLAPLTS